MKGVKNMRATGIIRRIDDLGRIVIPKEIRRTLGLHEGDPMEIFLDNDKGVIFKRYGGKLDDDMISLADQLDNEDMLEFADEMRQMVYRYRKLIKEREKRD